MVDSKAVLRASKWAKDNPERDKLNRLRAKSRKRNIDFDLTLEDIVIPDTCPILKISLDKSTKMFCPSVDRIDPTKGYVKGNIQIISGKANVMKSDASVEELKKFANWIYKSYTKENINEER